MRDPPKDDLNTDSSSSEIEASIDRVLSRYGAILPAHKLDELRRSLRFGASNHPAAQALLRGLRPRPAVERSGPTEALGIEDAEEKPRSGGDHR